jgi:uncharacterized damage-inducible protein DinB
MVRVETVLDSWRSIREDTALAVEEFPAAEFAFRPVPEVATFGEIARHILDAGHGLTGMLIAGEENFTGPDFRRKLAEHFSPLPGEAGAAALAAELRRSVEQRTGELAGRPADWWAHIVTRFDGQQVTRLELLQFVKEHELTHRAQMFLCMRMKGMVPPTTRRRQARQAGR